LAAAILAGGRARRFGGQDKCRLIVEGRAIIVRQVEVLQDVASEVFVVGPADRFADLGVPVHHDVIPDIGALGGLYTALAVAEAPLVLVVACDMPFLDAGLLRRLAELAAAADGAWVRGARGVEPLLACYRRTARDVVRTAIADGRLKAADLGAVLRMVEMDAREVERYGSAERLLANVNTPADYARIQ
jgi:molybdopterin-guanine dinucleotide biosynthesis protein A